MGGQLDPSVAQVRSRVRAHLARHLPLGPEVLVACSGGADSLALAAALAFETRHTPSRAHACVVDHGLQPGSDEVAKRTAEVLRGLGIADVRVRRAAVGTRGGPEGAARDARYALLRHAAEECGAHGVLLGHTRDDQAETVLLGLARGSGARSLSGMAPVAGLWHRPLLDVTRATTRAACRAAGLEPWDDPHNTDRAYTRVRVRHDALPALDAALGPGVRDALARTARLLREDADALDGWAASVEDPCDVTVLAALPRAVRTRVLRRAALEAGAPAGALGAGHIDAVDALVTDWRGQGRLDLPGGVGVSRACGRLAFDRG